jgi:hypothetical protein
VVDAFSRKYKYEGSLFALSLPISHWIDEVRREWLAHPTISQIIQQIQVDIGPPTDYTWKANVLRYKDHLVMYPYSTLNPKILNELHSSALAGHSRFKNTYAHSLRSFFEEGMKKDILTFVTECDICQCHKDKNVKTHVAL